MATKAPRSTIDAIYEQGHLRPLRPLHLKEGVRVRLRLEQEILEEPELASEPPQAKSWGAYSRLAESIRLEWPSPAKTQALLDEIRR